MPSLPVQFFCYYKAPAGQSQAIEAAQLRLFALLRELAPLSFSRKIAPTLESGSVIEQPQAEPVLTWLESAPLPQNLSPGQWLKAWREATTQSGLAALLHQGQHIEWFEALPPCA
jgi:hypothetical protein